MLDGFVALFFFFETLRVIFFLLATLHVITMCFDSWWKEPVKSSSGFTSFYFSPVMRHRECPLWPPIPLTPHTHLTSPAGNPSGPFVTDSGPQLLQTFRLAHLGSRVLITAVSKQTKPVGSPRGGSAPRSWSVALGLLKIRVLRSVPNCVFFSALVGPQETMASRQHLR